MKKRDLGLRPRLRLARADVVHETLAKYLSQKAFWRPEFLVPPAPRLGVDPGDDLRGHLYSFGFGALDQDLLRLEFLLMDAQAFDGFVLNIDRLRRARYA